MTTTATTRVRFIDGDRLDLADLVTEQTYHLEQFRRHLIGAHSWGILQGLDLEIDPDGRLLVAAGMAIDGYGRVLVLANPHQILPQLFIDRDADQLDLYLSYRVKLERSPGRGGCRPQVADRLVERPFVQAERPDPTRSQRWTPPGVPPADLGFGPAREPVAADRTWPVYLGRVTHDRNGTPPFALDPAGRRHAGVVAERIEAPSGEASLQVGRDLEGTGSGRLAFRARGQTRPLFEVDAKGDAILRGNATIEGDLAIGEAAWVFRKTVQSAPATPASVYRAKGRTTPKGPSKEVDTDELRIELPPPVAGGQRRFVIGVWSNDEKKFVELLSVEGDDGLVTVYGDLVEKVPTAKPKAPSVVPGFDAEAMQLIQAALLNAITGTGGAIANAVAGGGATGPFAGPGLGLSGQFYAEFLAQIMGSNPPDELIEQFATRLKTEHESLADKITKALESES